MSYKREAAGWDCYDDHGQLVAWFREMDDAVLWLAGREKPGTDGGLPKCVYCDKPATKVLSEINGNQTEVCDEHAAKTTRRKTK